MSLVPARTSHKCFFHKLVGLLAFLRSNHSTERLLSFFLASLRSRVTLPVCSKQPDGPHNAMFRHCSVNVPITEEELLLRYHAKEIFPFHAEHGNDSELMSLESSSLGIHIPSANLHCPAMLSVSPRQTWILSRANVTFLGSACTP